MDNAISKMRTIKEYFEADDDVVFVGVHYRGTDYVRHLEKMYNKEVDVSFPANNIKTSTSKLSVAASRPLQILRKSDDLL